MALYPVIMCGGVGARLWPASRPSRPKPFMPLSGGSSLFKETVARVAPLAENGGQLIVVGGDAHRELILSHLGEMGVEAQLLLEPEPRDSAPAMAAAALWTKARDPEGINIFVASDHHLPDHDAFRAAVRRAAVEAEPGRIITLGVRPTGPSSAYGYIRATGGELSPVAAFVEKPDSETAAQYIADGYLWNSGNFIVRAQTLLDELRVHAPAVETAAGAALAQAPIDDVVRLGEAFRSAPKISIDYAVMESTRLASVLAVDFVWSDLGAWDAIAAAGRGDLGRSLFDDAHGCLVRAPEGVLVAAVGVRDLAIVVEPDAVLVCALDQAQAMKRVVDRLRETSPRHLDFPKARTSADLGVGAQDFADWLRLRALPLWATVGRDEDGIIEVLTLDGRPVETVRRARVPARQAYVFAQAGRLGWRGPWRSMVEGGLADLSTRYMRLDGRLRTLLSSDGSSLNETATLYDQAFLLLAFSSAHLMGVTGNDSEAAATRLRALLRDETLALGWISEQGDQPYQANPHMHLLEACLAWEDAGGDAGWAAWADQLVDLAHRVFIDHRHGLIREYFKADGSPADGDAGRLIEPGHQFEWAWLLARYARRRDDQRSLETASRLYEAGLKGVEPRSRSVLDALDDTGEVRLARGRLWPQTEWLKAALILAETAGVSERSAYMRDAAAAYQALNRYLTPEGLWRDKRLLDGTFLDEPASASSFYHLMGAFSQLADSGAAMALEGMENLSLA